MAIDNAVLIVCPLCHGKFPLSEALVGPAREQLLAGELEQLRIAAREEVASELSAAQIELQEEKEAAAKARKREIDLLREQARLDREKEDLKVHWELERHRIVQQVREEAERNSAERFQAQLHERDARIQRLGADLERARQRADAGSAQGAGVEAQKMLGEQLKTLFPDDVITIMKQGQRGADVLHDVQSPGGRRLGAILWESKSTTSWNAAWIEKLRMDREESQASIGVLVSRTLPKDVAGSGLMGEVVVCSPAYVANLAPLLRVLIIKEAQFAVANANRKEVAGQVFDYLMTGEFVPRLVGSVEALASLQQSLAKEKRSAERQWAERERQIERAARSLEAIVSDLDGLGVRLPGLPELELPALPEAEALLPE